MFNFFKIMVMWVSCAISSGIAFAASSDLAVCPAIVDFKVSSFDLYLGYGVDVLAKNVNMLAVASYDSKKDIDFVIYPVNLASGETLLDKVNGLIPQLKAVSDVPVSFKIDSDHADVSVCAYSLPGNERVTALLYADGSERDTDGDFSSKGKHGAGMVQMLARQLMLK